MFDNHFKETELIDVICENCHDINIKISRSSFDNSHTLKNVPKVLIIILQRKEYNC